MHFSSRAYVKARSLAWVPSTVAIGNRAAAAADCGLSEEELIALHGAEVTVLMLGFASGHPYLGHYDERLALPRRRMPRTQVPRYRPAAWAWPIGRASSIPRRSRAAGR
ncbi:carboxyltransferase domain-containing protein [Pseudomonas sp. No.117]